MKLILVALGWLASLFAALVGVVFSFGAIHAPLEWLVVAACFVFAIAVNPLAIRKIQLLHKPLMVTALAIGAFIVGTASLVGSIPHDSSEEDKKADKLITLIQADSTLTSSQKESLVSRANEIKKSGGNSETKSKQIDDIAQRTDELKAEQTLIANYGVTSEQAELIYKIANMKVDVTNDAQLYEYAKLNHKLLSNDDNLPDVLVENDIQHLVDFFKTSEGQQSLAKMQQASATSKMITLSESEQARNTLKRLAKGKTR